MSSLESVTLAGDWFFAAESLSIVSKLYIEEKEGNIQI